MRNNIRRILKLLLPFYAFLLLCSISFSLPLDCVISGRVLDVSGQPILGALVELQGSRELLVLSDRAGYFRLVGLSPGLYQLSAKVLGFMHQVVQQVSLKPGQRLRVELVLKELPLEVAAQQQAVDLSWLLRRGKRDILRSRSLGFDGTPVEASASELKGSFTAEMALRDEIESRQALVELKAAEGSNWLLKAGFRQLEGMSLAAFGSWQQRLSPSHRLRLDFGYRDYYLSSGYAEAGKDWMASFQAGNSWRIARPWLLNWSLDYRHYHSLAGGDYISPRVEFRWLPQQDLALRGMVAYRVRGPEAAACEELLGFFLKQGSLQPERSLSYEIGIEHLSQNNYLVSLTAYYDQVEQYLISLYLPGQKRALSSNVGEAIVRGMKLALTKSFLRSWQASLSYSWQQAMGEELRRAIQMLKQIEGTEQALGFELSHEISTAFEALIKPTETRLKAIYRFNMAPLEKVGSLGEREMGFGSRLDLKVRQLLPQLGGASRWEVYLWLKNLLNQQQLNFFSLREEEPLGMPRVFISGVSIIF